MNERPTRPRVSFAPADEPGAVHVSFSRNGQPVLHTNVWLDDLLGALNTAVDVGHAEVQGSFRHPLIVRYRAPRFRLRLDRIRAQDVLGDHMLAALEELL